jgi:hypothetical protein
VLAVSGCATPWATPFHNSTATQALACQCLNLTFGLSNLLRCLCDLPCIRACGTLCSKGQRFCRRNFLQYILHRSLRRHSDTVALDWHDPLEAHPHL